jgi:uncharacterized membrane protein YqjE
VSTAAGAGGLGEPAYEEPSTHTRSIGEIVGDISTDLSTLMRQELDLAKAEAKQEVTRLGKGAGMFGGAALAGFFTLFFISLALTYLLDNWMPIELAALIVAVLWGIAAAVLASIGRKNVKAATPPMETTQQTLKEDAQWAKTLKS